MERRTVYLVVQNDKVTVDDLQRGGIQYGRLYDRKSDALTAAKEKQAQVNNWNCPSIKYSVATATLEVTTIDAPVKVPKQKQEVGYVGQVGLGLPEADPERAKEADNE